jgi:hypothetical protein
MWDAGEVACTGRRRTQVGRGLGWGFVWLEMGRARMEKKGQDGTGYGKCRGRARRWSRTWWRRSDALREKRVGSEMTKHREKNWVEKV